MRCATSHPSVINACFLKIPNLHPSQYAHRSSAVELAREKYCPKCHTSVQRNLSMAYKASKRVQAWEVCSFTVHKWALLVNGLHQEAFRGRCIPLAIPLLPSVGDLDCVENEQEASQARKVIAQSITPSPQRDPFHKFLFFIG
ncbi:hypothetical protein BDP27DRAFT_441872 [Rhodocollybia butyracea]|uniref:Uncharacterized protein n=1 Tax=Rhodocollybia butyracea TaxID=206335 RepID=A0A9P5Q1A6_9AGAR|nr:hypothetical protein BDP27DRAFT_441872 [Rhodocollybia butyracea]